mgnify:CR=1 FL=1
MARVGERTDRETMIQEFLDRTSLPRDFVEELVARLSGESEGDIVATRPLTAEERRRFGLGLTMEEARERMLRRAQESARAKAGA